MDLPNNIPSDPAILTSYINTLLRDKFNGNLDELCLSLQINRKALEEKLGQAGFLYSEPGHRFI